jgi:hypothetical protein
MLSILIVGRPPSGSLEPPDPSLEILHAEGAEDALEKLGRNRRIDAVLLAAGSENAEIERAIREDNPAPPPLFRAEGYALAEMVERIVTELEGR